VAFSYVRFSDSKQRKGDSVRRQTEARERWLADHPDVPLDSTLTDAGRSAFKGKHRAATAALGGFLEEVRGGSVHPGDYLPVENLDRLTREETGKAVEVFLSIVNAGVVVVQLLPAVMEFKQPVNLVGLIIAVVELGRGHSESAMKSARSLANWDEAQRLAAAGEPVVRKKDGVLKAGTKTKAMTGRLPGWVELTDDGAMRLIPDRAAAVSRIFELAADDCGMTTIVKVLTREGVPAFGDREADGDGHTRKRPGRRYGCGEWRTCYVRSILRDRRALGEFQPRDSEGRPRGEPISNYYPPAVTEAVLRQHEARAAAIKAVLDEARREAARPLAETWRDATGSSGCWTRRRARNGKSCGSSCGRSSAAWSRRCGSSSSARAGPASARPRCISAGAAPGPTC
jgi:DNA invertase Pin-like site-specific DNA recombinase